MASPADFRLCLNNLSGTLSPCPAGRPSTAPGPSKVYPVYISMAIAAPVGAAGMRAYDSWSTTPHSNPSVIANASVAPLPTVPTPTARAQYPPVRGGAADEYDEYPVPLPNIQFTYTALDDSQAESKLLRYDGITHGIARHSLTPDHTIIPEFKYPLLRVTVEHKGEHKEQGEHKLLRIYQYSNLGMVVNFGLVSNLVKTQTEYQILQHSITHSTHSTQLKEEHIHELAKLLQVLTFTEVTEVTEPVEYVRTYLIHVDIHATSINADIIHWRMDHVHLGEINDVFLMCATATSVRVWWATVVGGTLDSGLWNRTL